MSIDLEAALETAGLLGLGEREFAAAQTIRDLVAEIRSTRMLLDNTCELRDQAEKERDEARRQLESAMQLKPLLDEARRLLRQEKELRDQALGIMDGMESKLTVAREALETYSTMTVYFGGIEQDCGEHAREALAKIGGSDAPA